MHHAIMAESSLSVIIVHTCSYSGLVNGISYTYPTSALTYLDSVPMREWIQVQVLEVVHCST